MNKSDHLVLWGDLDNTVLFKENVDDICNVVKEYSSNLRLDFLHNPCHEVFVSRSYVAISSRL